MSKALLNTFAGSQVNLTLPHTHTHTRNENWTQCPNTIFVECLAFIGNFARNWNVFAKNSRFLPQKANFSKLRGAVVLKSRHHLQKSRFHPTRSTPHVVRGAESLIILSYMTCNHKKNKLDSTTARASVFPIPLHTPAHHVGRVETFRVCVWG